MLTSQKEQVRTKRVRRFVGVCHSKPHKEPQWALCHLRLFYPYWVVPLIVRCRVAFGVTSQNIMVGYSMTYNALKAIRAIC